jgi:hypothetical protein
MWLEEVAGEVTDSYCSDPNLGMHLTEVVSCSGTVPAFCGITICSSIYVIRGTLFQQGVFWLEKQSG